MKLILFISQLLVLLLPAIGFSAEPSVRSEPPAVAFVLRGTVTNYSFSVWPGNWDVIRSARGYDMTFSLENRLNFGVVIGPVQAGDLKSFAESARRVLQANHPTLQLSLDQRVTVTGREWQRFQLSGRLGQDDVMLICQVYSGPDGTVEIVGSSYADEAMQNRRDITRVLASFTFPHAAPGTSSKAKPVTTQTNTPPVEKAP